jgi:competence protein ComFC
MNILPKKLVNILGLALSIFFPDKCVSCNKPGELLCELCINKTRHPERDLPKGIYAACDYRDPQIKRALLFLKYYKKRRLGKVVGKIMYERLMEEISDLREYTKGNPILLVPVPLSRKRMRERGYNQAIDIAKGFMDVAKSEINNEETPLFQILINFVVKDKETKQQAKIKNRNERLNNLKNCFSLNKKNTFDLKGRTVVVIDDITTTGSTITEIMKVLTEAGAKKVVGFAVAH